MAADWDEVVARGIRVEVWELLVIGYVFGGILYMGCRYLGFRVSGLRSSVEGLGCAEAYTLA